MESDNTITKDDIYVPSERTAYRKIGEKYVLIHTLDNKLVRLNTTGSAIWGWLDGSTLEQVSKKLESNYEVAKEDAFKDTQEFLCSMLQRGFLEKRKPEK